MSLSVGFLVRKKGEWNGLDWMGWYRIGWDWIRVGDQDASAAAGGECIDT